MFVNIFISIQRPHANIVRYAWDMYHLTAIQCESRLEQSEPTKFGLYLQTYTNPWQALSRIHSAWSLIVWICHVFIYEAINLGIVMVPRISLSPYHQGVRDAHDFWMRAQNPWREREREFCCHPVVGEFQTKNDLVFCVITWALVFRQTYIHIYHLVITIYVWSSLSHHMAPQIEMFFCLYLLLLVRSPACCELIIKKHKQQQQRLEAGTGRTGRSQKWFYPNSWKTRLQCKQSMLRNFFPYPKDLILHGSLMLLKWNSRSFEAWQSVLSRFWETPPRLISQA